MQFKLFARGSEKSALQQSLDRDRGSSEKTVVEDLPVAAPAAKSAGATTPLFTQPPKQGTTFHVDLLGGWVKP